MSHHVDIISDILAENVPTNVAGGLMPTVIGSRDPASSIRIKIHHSITHLLAALGRGNLLFYLSCSWKPSFSKSGRSFIVQYTSGEDGIGNLIVAV